MRASELVFQTPPGENLVDITAAVTAQVKAVGISDGFCVLFVPHTTAGITINENADPDVRSDLLLALSRMVPRDIPFRHVEGNSPAHVKAMLVGHSVTIPIQEGRMAFGSWQGAYLCEFDGPRRRRVIMQVVAQP